MDPNGEIVEEAEEDNGFRRFDVVSDDSDHHYVKLNRTANSDADCFSNAASGVYSKIMQEWKILEKNLPDSIFVRVYERRIDLLRAVIVGAVGTPYHDGLFAFDLAFPPDYPAHPPQVHYRSFGLRLNPNLYANGRVCLSLLNTWVGRKKEKWDPSQSTVLQVLVSLQGLVLNEKPYFNEPGHGVLPGRSLWEKNSMAYSETVFALSCKTMLFMLRKPPKNFEALIAAHFRDRALFILEACNAYTDGRVKVGYYRGDGSSSSSSSSSSFPLAMDSATIRASSSSLSSSSSSFFSLLPNPNPSPNPGLFSLRFPGGDLPVFKSIRCIQSPPPDSAPSSQSPLKPNSRSPGFSFSCSAVSFSPSRTSELASCKLGRLISEFRTLEEPVDRVKRLLHYASVLPPLEESARVAGNRVMGCTAQVWLEVKMDGEGRMRFAADSDSEITKGFCSCLIWVLEGAAPEEVLALKTDDLAALNVGLPGAGHSRVNTWHNVLIGMHKRTKALVAERAGKPRADPFPSLVINADGIHAKGSYAEAQARFLFPEELKVKELVNVLKEKKIGVAAHFYMDPEVQGVLTAAQKEWPHIYISDSLIMADMAVKMAKAGCQFIAVLGVDFMAENVRAILDQAGFGEVGVYRMSNERIGCSLADAAATPAYMNYLEAASASPPALHVVYINTSLETKAYAHELVPTITCTSSNVVQTILQAFAQVPNLNIWYGPDTYMGANIRELLQQMTTMTDEEIAVIHPQHNRDSIKSLLSHLHYYQDGTCIVHHLFGHEVVEKINEMYCDAFLTAHLEVPGEMFSLAMEAKRRGTGVVGSTQNILDFIKQRVQESLDKNQNDHLQFVLGTESGMVTSIVAAVRTLLGSAKSSSGSADVTVEIVFPVSSESLTKTSSNSYLGRNSVEMGGFILPVIPGVASGEGCSIHGGCASCPYMKMNSLSSLLKVCHHLPHEKEVLSDYEAGRFHSQTPNGNSIADVGCEPILNMRHFQATKELPEKLVSQILHSHSNGRSTSIS